MGETLVSTFRRYATDSPKSLFATVVSANGRIDEITYGRYWAEASGVAAGLYSAGIREKDVVMCLGEQSARLLFAIGGCFLLGAIPTVVPHHSEKSDDDTYSTSLAGLCRIADVRAALVSDQEYRYTAEALNGTPGLRAVLSMERFGPGVWTPTPSVLADVNRTLLLQHSSGTTGLQKGVALTDAAVTGHVRVYWSELNGSSGDVIVSWLPLYHDMGLITGFVLPLLVKVPLVLLSPFAWIAKPSTLLSAISSHRGTISWLPNFAFNVLIQKVRDIELLGIDLSSWRAVINCSEPIQWSSCTKFVQRFQSVGLHETCIATCYGMAENTFAVTQSPVGSELAVDWVDETELLNLGVARAVQPGSARARAIPSCGRPIPNVTLRILGEDGDAIGDRQVGEIAIQSPYTLRSYFGRPDLSQAAFREGWFLTGDLGYVIDGEAFVCGRTKDVIIIAGINYYPQDFEIVAESVQGIKAGRTIAFGVSNERTGTEDLVLLLEAGPFHVVDPSEIRREVRQRVASTTGCVPREIHLLQPGWLLKTSSGKIARVANKEKFLKAFGRDELPAIG